MSKSDRKAFTKLFFKKLILLTNKLNMPKAIEPQVVKKRKPGGQTELYQTTMNDLDQCNVKFAIEVGPKHRKVHAHMLVRMRHKTGARFYLKYSQIRRFLKKELGLPKNPYVNFILTHDNYDNLKEYILKNRRLFQDESDDEPDDESDDSSSEEEQQEEEENPQEQSVPAVVSPADHVANGSDVVSTTQVQDK